MAAITAGVLILLIISMLFEDVALRHNLGQRKPVKKKNVPIVEEPVSATDNSNDNEKSDDSAEDVGIKTDALDEEAQVEQRSKIRERSDDHNLSPGSLMRQSQCQTSLPKVSHEEVVQTVRFGFGSAFTVR